jgi:hypothetical protein
VIEECVQACPGRTGVGQEVRALTGPGGEGFVIDLGRHKRVVVGEEVPNVRIRVVGQAVHLLRRQLRVRRGYSTERGMRGGRARLVAVPAAGLLRSRQAEPSPRR